MPDSKLYVLSLNNEEYELKMSLTESFIEFNLVPKNAISDFYFNEKYELSTINENKYLIKSFKELKEAFEIFDRLFKDKRIQLVKLKEETINLNIKIPSYFGEEETNLELKRYKMNKEDVYPLLLNEIKEIKKELLENKTNLKDFKKEISSNQEKQRNEMKKEMLLLFEDYLKKKNEEENKKEQEKEKLLRQQEEEKLKHNDNTNYLNDFQCENIENMRDINYISNQKFNLQNKSVAIYSIIRNDKRTYELACFKRGQIYRESYYYFNIVIYDILLNEITNKIYEVFSNYNNELNNIKHYYYPSSKKHFLLSSSRCSIKLWNISSKIIKQELAITTYNDNNYREYCKCSCLLFNNENYYIFGGIYYLSNSTWKMEMRIFNKDKNQKNINKSNLINVSYIEATYIKNKPYILLGGNNHSESYDYNNDSLKVYKSEEIFNNGECKSINIFNKDEKNIYLMSGYSDGRVIIFDFFSTKEIFSIKIGDSCINGLCLLNKKYFLVGDNKEIKVIDFDKKSIIKNYKDLSDASIIGIEKIKIPEKGELVISYSENVITFWK